MRSELFEFLAYILVKAERYQDLYETAKKSDNVEVMGMFHYQARGLYNILDDAHTLYYNNGESYEDFIERVRGFVKND